MARALAAYGRPLPDYIEILAKECDRTSQRAAASKIGYALGAVSMTLSASYRGNPGRMEAAIRRGLMGQDVTMPSKRQRPPRATERPAKARAVAGWQAPPDWIAALAHACSHATQESVGRKIGYSGSAINAVLANRYTGNMQLIEAAVRGALLGETCSCPVLGDDLRKDACVENQRREWKRVAADAIRKMIYQACHGGRCPNSCVAKKRKQA
jgi:hypothetical protein